LCPLCSDILVRNGNKQLKRISIREITFEKVQQWLCINCRHSFTFRRNNGRQHFTDIFIREAVKDFIQGRSSYAVIKERKNVSIGTLSSWVHQFGLSCMTPVEISGALRFRTVNKWSGILILDAKYLNKRTVLLLAIDYGTLDIVAHLVCEAESEENYIKLIGVVKLCDYIIQAVVSDGEPAIITLTQPKKPYYFIKGTGPRPGHKSATQFVPLLLGIPHQWCVVHAERELKHYINKLLPDERKSIEFLIRQTLFAKTIKQAEKWRGELLESVYHHPSIYRIFTVFLVSRWELLTAHFSIRVNGRKMPRSTNSIENIISYVNTRLKTMRRLRSFASAIPITNLIVVNFRTKPLINTKNKLKRGKSPLELVTGKKCHFDWMDFIKKSCS
jgi:transposase-like protein